MLTVGDRIPQFCLPAVVGLEPGKEFRDVTDESARGKWLVLFFWPMDFTFVCPTEIAEFGRRHGDFLAREAVVFGASTDTHYVHLAWRRQDPTLRELPFPMLADHQRRLVTALGILHPTEGVPLRATFIVDPHGIVRFVQVNDLDVGRSVPEVLRVLDALQAGGLTPCNWERGQPILQAS
jgi:peroxiredoxin (alkyl hydroperoxide reductase subunit C)